MGLGFNVPRGMGHGMLPTWHIPSLPCLEHVYNTSRTRLQHSCSLSSCLRQEAGMLTLSSYWQQRSQPLHSGLHTCCRKHGVH